MSAPDLFIHQPLGDASRQIRLVTIEPIDHAHPTVIVCRMETFQLEGDGRPPYKALSYQWNALEGAKFIMLNVKLIKVTSNLYQALMQFRRDTTIRHLWIDALCIDQTNHDEKSQQIPLMGNIFAYADEVLVWLTGRGMDLVDHERAVNFLEDWVGAAISAQESPEVESPDYHQQPTSLCRADSLFRVVALNLDAFQAAITPFDDERWMELYPLLHCQYWGRPELSSPAQSEEGPGIWLRAFSYQSWILPAVEKLSLLYGTKVTSGLSMSLADIVDLTGGSEATDPRDRVYGLLGLVDSQNAIEPDYDMTAAEVYTRFATDEIARTNSLEVCFLSCGLVGRETPDLRTWIPDLANTKRAEQFSLIKNLRELCSAAGQNTSMVSTSDSGRRLSVQGWRATARIHLVETKLAKEALFETLQRFYTVPKTKEPAISHFPAKRSSGRLQAI
ncbi:hypothetical protein PG997_000390 [Apiospora hydei]|uniref:Heterokaryon incompatibility domain-containing protein n=1 Tax=Apiospora hydei TaxID=1337664 RepID=A0ABR1XAM6_9PEZI